MTAETFEQEVYQRGRKLMILDEFVLDVADFAEWHPGGKFVINHNIGRDVSKFFYGGYAQDGNGGPSPARGYNHSYYAKRIVNDLIICRYDPTAEVASAICKVDQSRAAKVNSTTGVVFLQTVDGHKRHNFKEYHAGYSMIGKHYLVGDLGLPLLYRHYTICSAMNPKFSRFLIGQLGGARKDSELDAVRNRES